MLFRSDRFELKELFDLNDKVSYDPSISIFYNLRESDLIGKITVTEDTPFYKDSPIYGSFSDE